MKVGDTVKLKSSIGVKVPEGREANPTAVIKTLLTRIEGGVFLERDLMGSRYWNVADLHKITVANKEK